MFIFNMANLKILAIFVFSNYNISFTSQILKIVGPSGEKFDFSVPWDLKHYNIGSREDGTELL